ncbi:MAG: hypothetical protein AAF206_21010 [Bacteroidota bacterium]
MKTFFRILGVLLVIVLIAGIAISQYTADLRNDFVKQHGEEAEMKTKGKALLEASAAKHGIHNWDSVVAYTAVFQDQFFGPMKSIANPWKVEKVDAEISYVSGRFEGQISERNSKLVWAMKDGQTAAGQIGGELSWAESQEARFWVPTVQYFIEFHKRILEADKVTYAGEASWNGKTYDQVFVSWNTFEPQDDIDQYLIWISKESGLMEILQYTVREGAGFYTGTAFQEDFSAENGIMIAHSMPVTFGGPDGDQLHHMQFSDFRFVRKAD